MTGYLTQTLGEWMVKHGKDNDSKIYPLCPNTKEWMEKNKNRPFIREGIAVVFDFIVKGEYCETKEEIIKNYFAKIKRVEHDSL